MIKGFRRKCEKCKSMSEISTGASNVLSHEPSSKNAITTATTITLAEGESRRPSSNSQVIFNLRDVTRNWYKYYRYLTNNVVCVRYKNLLIANMMVLVSVYR